MFLIKRNLLCILSRITGLIINVNYIFVNIQILIIPSFGRMLSAPTVITYNIYIAYDNPSLSKPSPLMVPAVVTITNAEGSTLWTRTVV